MSGFRVSFFSFFFFSSREEQEEGHRLKEMRFLTGWMVTANSGGEGRGTEGSSMIDC